MPDVVTSQTIVNGDRNIVQHFTCLSDGTGETAAVKVDVSALGCTEVAVEKILYSVYGFEVTLAWDATTDVTFAVLQGQGVLDFTRFGGIPDNSAAANRTGDIVLTTAGARADAGDSYVITLEMRKVA